MVMVVVAIPEKVGKKVQNTTFIDWLKKRLKIE